MLPKKSRSRLASVSPPSCRLYLQQQYMQQPMVQKIDVNMMARPAIVATPYGVKRNDSSLSPILSESVVETGSVMIDVMSDIFEIIFIRYKNDDTVQ